MRGREARFGRQRQCTLGFVGIGFGAANRWSVPIVQPPRPMTGHDRTKMPPATAIPDLATDAIFWAQLATQQAATWPDRYSDVVRFTLNHRKDSHREIAKREADRQTNRTAAVKNRRDKGRENEQDQHRDRPMFCTFDGYDLA